MGSASDSHDEGRLRDTEVTANVFFRHSRVKQYPKARRALRIETVVNSADKLRCHRRLAHLDELHSKARDLIRRLLNVSGRAVSLRAQPCAGRDIYTKVPATKDR